MTNAERAMTILDSLIPTLTESGKVPIDEKITSITSRSKATTSGAGVSLNTPVGIRASGSSSGSSTNVGKVETSYHVISEDKVIFPAVGEILSETLELTDSNLYIFIDEWSSLPGDIQPYLAEFLKRSILPLQRVVLKIAAMEYRTKFSAVKENLIGFELGADISTAPDLDDYYVFDKNPDKITDAYADMLLRHMDVELEKDYLKTHYGVYSGRDLGSKLFTQRPTLRELARASEGVIRDLINIFTKAFFHAQRQGRDTIDNKAVLEGAREWFEQDKARGLDEVMQETLRRIVDEVIGTRKARSFLLQRDLERHPMIQRLIDARVVHHMQRGYADKDHPGVRYNIYSLDYGTYVGLIGTSKQPDLELREDDSAQDAVVPFDDKRSIRRIVLDASILGGEAPSS